MYSDERLAEWSASPWRDGEGHPCFPLLQGWMLWCAHWSNVDALQLIRNAARGPIGLSGRGDERGRTLILLVADLAVSQSIDFEGFRWAYLCDLLTLKRAWLLLEILFQEPSSNSRVSPRHRHGRHMFSSRAAVDVPAKRLPSCLSNQYRSVFQP